MTILVTGATSAVGYFIAKRVREQYPETEIKALSRSGKKAKELEELEIGIVKGDLTDINSLYKALQGVDIVYNAAGEARDYIPSNLYYEVNVDGTRNILEAFVKNKGKRFMHVSTVGIYGYQPKHQPIKETHPKKSDHPYHKTKMIAEDLVFQYAREHGFFATAVRPPYIVGPRDRQVAPKVFDYLLKERKIPLVGGGNAIVSFVHHDDVAEALVLSGEVESANGEAFHVIGGTCTARELFQLAGEITGKEPIFQEIGFPLAITVAIMSETMAKIKGSKPKISRRRVNQFSRTRVYSIDKLKEIVGFVPKYDVKKAFQDAFTWMKEEKII
ncbi:MAG: NAD-dependent epimerase/dehydratase family protein [Candidatus Heimdallarchaeota archaeon]|nr:NAD-dependent epimerase/dehydratase family protein [Candidatus Heimdallarchaeota archaeon]